MNYITKVYKIKYKTYEKQRRKYQKAYLHIELDQIHWRADYTSRKKATGRRWAKSGPEVARPSPWRARALTEAVRAQFLPTVSNRHANVGARWIPDSMHQNVGLEVGLGSIQEENFAKSPLHLTYK
jgi:hypothetical protein